MTPNIIYIVALGVGFKCPRKIHLNTQWGRGASRNVVGKICHPHGWDMVCIWLTYLPQSGRGEVLSPAPPQFLGPCKWLTEYWKPTLSLTIHSSSKFSASVVPLRQGCRKVWKWWYMCNGHNLPPVWNRGNWFTKIPGGGHCVLNGILCGHFLVIKKSVK